MKVPNKNWRLGFFRLWLVVSAIWVVGVIVVGPRGVESYWREPILYEMRSIGVSAIIEGMAMKRKIKPVHPGRILRDEFMEPAGISQYRLARATGLSQERALGMSAQTWMNLQTLYELEKASAEAGRRIRQTTERLNLREAA